MLIELLKNMPKEFLAMLPAHVVPLVVQQLMYGFVFHKDLSCGEVTKACPRLYKHWTTYPPNTKNKLFLGYCTFSVRLTRDHLFGNNNEPFQSQICKIVAHSDTDRQDAMKQIIKHLFDQGCVGLQFVSLAVNFKSPEPKKNKEPNHEDEEQSNRRNGKRMANSVPHLRLDDAIKGDYATWSDARKIAFSKIHTNPNTYYFRFNAPGEKQKNGPFTEEEKKKFIQRVTDGKFNPLKPLWGMLSIDFPGRVGYHCASMLHQDLLT
jgi:hypothetical protein